MEKEKILVVEDEPDILELVSFNLSKENYNVIGVISGNDVISTTKSEKPDLIVLDLMLPGMNGLDICKLLKREPETQDIPIVMMTAKSEEADIVTGLELGADDYITKPFSPRILIARIRAVLRRRTGADKTIDENEILSIHDLTINPGRHEVLIKNKHIKLTSTEFKLLHFLASRPSWVFTRYQIVDAVRGEDYPVTDRSVDVQIVGLRKKLGAPDKYIETVRGVGYRFKE